MKVEPIKALKSAIERANYSPAQTKITPSYSPVDGNASPIPQVTISQGWSTAKVRPASAPAPTTNTTHAVVEAALPVLLFASVAGRASARFLMNGLAYQYLSISSGAASAQKKMIDLISAALASCEEEMDSQKKKSKWDNDEFIGPSKALFAVKYSLQESHIKSRVLTAFSQSDTKLRAELKLAEQSAQDEKAAEKAQNQKYTLHQERKRHQGDWESTLAELGITNVTKTDPASGQVRGAVSRLIVSV